MHKARKEILKTLDQIDVLIEIVDARLPFSSQNPLINQWRRVKPTIVMLSKADLADPAITREWQSYFAARDKVETLAYGRHNPSKLKQIPQLCARLVADKSTGFKPINAMVLGIPNVGKSTLINALAGRAVTRVGDEPAVTRRQQKIHLDGRVMLHDTPGILWPKIDNPHGGYRLAIAGSIKNTATDYEDMGFYAADYLLAAYPQRLLERYQLEDTPPSAWQCLEALGARRGARQSGGRINPHKAAEILIHDLRAGHLGKVSLETPAMIERELAEVAIEQQQKAEQRASRKQRRKGSDGE